MLLQRSLMWRICLHLLRRVLLDALLMQCLPLLTEMLLLLFLRPLLLLRPLLMLCIVLLRLSFYQYRPVASNKSLVPPVNCFWVVEGNK